MLYGIYFHKNGDLDEALEKYQKALEIEPGSAEAHYNVGLLHVDRGELESAVGHAQRAYELGYPLHGLKNRLQREGAWPGTEEAPN